GELLIGGDGLARGYVGAPDLTAEKYMADCVSGALGARLYRTGDLVRRRWDGNVEYIGRKDRQGKGRGDRIELAEVEGTIRGHDGVEEAVVALRGEGVGKGLVAYVVLRQGIEMDQIRTYLRERLPEYMIPDLFIEVEEMPLTSSGKVDRRK